MRGGILVASVAIIGGVLLAFWWLATRSSADNAPISLRTVKEGETLWQIATEIAPDRDPRITVRVIREMNHLSDSTIYPGEVLKVPGGERP